MKQDYKYKKIYQQLRAMIEQGQWLPGQKLPSQRDLMQEYDVSFATITSAQKALAEDRLIVSHHGRGTFVADKDDALHARRSPSRRNRTIGLFTRQVSGNPMGMLKGIYDETQRTGNAIEFILFHGESQRRERCRRILEGEIDVDGCLIPHLPGYNDVVEAMREHGFPYIVFDSPRRYDNVNQVMLDHCKGAAAAVEHLIRHGHEHIAYLGTELLRDGEEDDWAAAKFQGYQAALEKAGLAVEDSRVMCVPAAGQHVPTYDDTCRAMKALLERSSFSAVLVAVGAMSVAAIDVLRAEGRPVPRDVAVMSFNSDEHEEMSRERYSVSSVIAPREEVGRTATHALMKLIEAGPDAAPLVEEMEMVLVRQHSCGCVVDG